MYSNLSPLFKCEIGVRQGDDTVVLADSPGDLQNALNVVHDYCQLWKLHLNTSKTKIVIFSRGKVRKFPFSNLERIA